jgi:hypothetical protein
MITAVLHILMSQIYRDYIPKVSTLAMEVSLPLSMYKDVRE